MDRHRNWDRDARHTQARESPSRHITAGCGVGYAANVEEVAPLAAAGTSLSLQEMLAPLPESQREVIEMLKVAGMSLEEVARATSSSVGAVKQKAFRAYEKLRGVLGKMGGPS